MLWLLIAAWAASIAVGDWRHRRIPNALTFSAAAVALVWLVARGQTLLGGSPADAALGFGVALALTLPGYALGKLGAGDVKFLAAFGLMSDAASVLIALAVGSLIAVLAGLVWGRLALAGWVRPAAGRRYLPMGTFWALGIGCALALQL